MNVLLADYLVCPKCGPPFGLILLADDVRDRRIVRGVFGCTSCRDRFPVEDGFGDLRPAPREPRSDAVVGANDGPGGAAGAGDEGEAAAAALRLAAALGVARGPGLLLVGDGFASEAGRLAGMVRDIEVVVVGWRGRDVVGGGGGRAEEESAGDGDGPRRVAGSSASAGVSAFVTGPAMPLRDAVARGVAAAGEAGAQWWDECLRVLMPGGRMVVSNASDAAREWARGAGLAVVLDEGRGEAGGTGMLVAALPMPGQEPKPMAWKSR